MSEIAFTQFLRPDGRRTTVWFQCDQALADKAEGIIRRGYRFECEELTTGDVSFTIANDEFDLAIEVCPNGPEVPGAIERLINDFLANE